MPRAPAIFAPSVGDRNQKTLIASTTIPRTTRMTTLAATDPFSAPNVLSARLLPAEHGCPSFIVFDFGGSGRDGPNRLVPDLRERTDAARRKHVQETQDLVPRRVLTRNP